MKVHVAKFVLASDLFGGMDSLHEALSDSDPPFSWGDNNRSLVTAETIWRHLDGEDIGAESARQKLRRRIESLPEQYNTYVDMEN